MCSFVLPLRMLPLRVLPLRMLPLRVLPLRVLHIIKEYSRPITRANWRQSKPIISTYQLYLTCRINNEYKFKLFCIIIDNIQRTDWYSAYIFIQNKGIHRYYQHHNIRDSKIVDVDGIKDAIYEYNGNNRYYEYNRVY